MSHTTMDVEELSGLAEVTFVEGYADKLDRGMLASHAQEVFVPELLADLASGLTELLCAHDEGQVVGYATVRRVPTSHGLTLRMDRLYVRPDHQRRGHGRRLVERILTLNSSYRATRLCLGVWEANDRAIAFYEAMGFSPMGIETFRLGGLVQRDIVMCRSLVDDLPTPREVTHQPRALSGLDRRPDVTPRPE